MNFPKPRSSINLIFVLWPGSQLRLVSLFTEPSENSFKFTVQEAKISKKIWRRKINKLSKIVTNRKHLVLPLNWKYRIFNVPKTEQNFPVLRALYSWAEPFQSVNSFCSASVSRYFLGSKVGMNFSKKPKLAISILCSPATSHFSSSKHCSGYVVWVALSDHSCHQSTSHNLQAIPPHCPVPPGSSGRAPASCAPQLWCWQLSPRRTGMGSWTWERCCTKICGRDTQMVNDAIRTYLKSSILGLLLTTHRFFSRGRQRLVQLDQTPQGSCAAPSSQSSSSEHASSCTKAKAHRSWLSQDPQLCPVLQTQYFRLLVTVWSVILT